MRRIRNIAMVLAVAALAAACSYVFTGYYDKTTSLSVSSDGSSILPEGETGGTFNFGVIWESRNPEFGEDYDRRMFYVLAVAPDGKKGWAEANVSSLSGSPKYVAVTVK